MVTDVRMAFGPACRWPLALGLAVGFAVVRPPGPDPAVEAASVRAALNLRLTASDLLPQASRRAMMREAQAIWDRGHVQLRWLTGNSEPGPCATLRVLVTPKAVASHGDGPSWTVGELLRFDGASAIAVASITRPSSLALRPPARQDPTDLC